MNNGLSTTRAHSGSQTRTITPPVNGALSGYVCNSSCPLFKRAHAHHSPWVRSSLIRATRDDTTRELSCHVTCVFELNHSLRYIVPFLLASFVSLQPLLSWWSPLILCHKLSLSSSLVLGHGSLALSSPLCRYIIVLSL